MKPELTCAVDSLILNLDSIRELYEYTLELEDKLENALAILDKCRDDKQELRVENEALKDLGAHRKL